MTKPLSTAERCVEVSGRSDFRACPFDLEFSDGSKQHVNLSTSQDLDIVLNTLIEKAASHQSTRICFDQHIPIGEVAIRMGNFQQSVLAEDLQFSLSQNSDRVILVQSKVLEVEDLVEGKTQRTYANGVIETFDNSHEGYRIYPDGTRERGKFTDGLSPFIRHYRIEVDGSVTFTYPVKFATFVDKSSKKYRYEFIVEFENKLVVLEKIFNSHRDSYYVMRETPPSDVLLAAAKTARTYPEANKISDCLAHKSFEEYLPGFINSVFMSDESGIPQLFGLPEQAAIVIVECLAKLGLIDPLKVIDPISGKNLFTHAACFPESKLLKKLIELFPESYQSIAQDVIETLIQHGYKASYIEKLIVQFHQRDGELVYHELWSDIANKKPPDQKFNDDFAVLSSKHKKILYEAAFACNNPYIFEPAPIPVEPGQYSINLMWINDKKMPEDQEFLFGVGDTPEDKELDFQNRFVKPVAEWAKKNPGSPINIWVDGALATSGSIERSRIALEKLLEGTSHGIIKFRDVRSIPMVQDPNVSIIFNPDIPVYFRVDLLRALAAEYTLENKETQYFVYGDLDMKPLSGNELFDRRTIDFLKLFGIVMAKGGAMGYENGFYILNGANSRFMKSHRRALIDPSIIQARRKPDKINSQQFFSHYSDMWCHFTRAKKDRPKLTVNMPTKPVQMPPSHFHCSTAD